ARVFEGLRDTYSIVLDAVDSGGRAGLASLRTALESACSLSPSTLAAAWTCLDRIGSAAADHAGNLATVPESEATWWAQTLTRQCRSARDDLQFLAPWIVLPPAPPGLRDPPRDAKIPTLRELARLESELSPTTEGAPDVQATAEQSS